jgi:adenylate cyclase
MLEQAMRASPHDPLMWAWLFWLTLSHYYGREYEAALAASERLIRFRPDVFSAYRFRAASLAQLGRTEEAQKALRECLAAYETAGVDFRKFLRERHPWHRPADFSHLVEGLRLAGLPE